MRGPERFTMQIVVLTSGVNKYFGFVDTDAEAEAVRKFWSEMTYQYDGVLK